MNLTAVHGYLLGFAVIGAWATVAGWALALRFSSYEHTPTFWRAVSVAQVLLAVQILLGLVLLALGRRPGDGRGLSLGFHLAYGVVFPLVTLVVGHRVARAGQYSPHSVFALVGLVLFGLSARAWAVGVAGA